MRVFEQLQVGIVVLKYKDLKRKKIISIPDKRLTALVRKMCLCLSLEWPQALRLGPGPGQ